MSAERDFEAWCEEKAKWEAEVGRARQMEKESFDRFEVSPSPERCGLLIIRFTQASLLYLCFTYRMQSSNASRLPRRWEL